MSEDKVIAIEIPLTKGYIATVDVVDGDLSGHKWHYMANPGYAVTRIERKNAYMHRLVLQRVLGRVLVKGEFCDHIDGNGLNNCRSNLRLATRQQNMHNQRRNRLNTSGYKGVCRSSDKKRWVSRVKANNVVYHLGTFDTPELAYEAYCKAAIELHGEFARLE